MIYTKQDIEKEIERYFKEDVEGDNEDIIRRTKKLVEDILGKSDVIAACHDIRDAIVNLSMDGVLVYKDKKFLPQWVKYLVYLVIYQYLDNNKNKKPAYTQTNLLKEMGLYGDIFEKKNWCMYSPDMKIRQVNYKPVELPLNHAEVESNAIFRAMIHYMVCYSTVLTDTFIDVFGKLGLIPALCANGYAPSQTWVELGTYKELLVFMLALEKKETVCKRLAKYQNKIKNSTDMIETVATLIGRAVTYEITLWNLSKGDIHALILNPSNFSMANTASAAGGGADTAEIAADIVDSVDANTTKQSYSRANIYDIYDFAACFMIQQYFAPEYWRDSNLTPTFDINGNETLSAELKDKLTKPKINLFVDTDFSDGIRTLSDAYKAKRFIPKCVASYTEVVHEMCLDKYDIREAFDDRELLFLDVPKYLREEKRFEFDIEWYKELFDVLSKHEGDWILAWKNYIEPLTLSAKSDSIYAKLVTEDKVISMDEDFGLDNPARCVRVNRMKELYDALLEISSNRQLYIFRYKSEDRNHPNSIVLITTIDFPLPKEELTKTIFEDMYNIKLYDYGNQARLIKESYEIFYLNAMKWLMRK